MAVDANVLIFERIREELRAGTSMVRAVELGYDKAFSSIFDSNVTTLLSAVILFFLGSGPIKGFAITLIIGIFCSFFTAVYISRVILVWFVTKKNPTTIGFHTVFSKNLFQNLNFDYIGKRKAAYAFSISLLVLGAVSIVAQGGLNLGVDFKGGRSYIVQFAQPVEASDLKVNLSDAFAQTGTEVKTFGSSSKVKVTTSYLIDDESADGDKKVEDALSAGLTKYKNSKFEILSSSKVGPTIADDIKTSSYWSLLLSLVGIFIYVAFRFKNRSFGWGGVIALLHDAAMTVAVFSIVRWFGISYEIDQVFVAAILTIVGYSINDTVVMFDRVREFSEQNPAMAENNKAQVLNDSINHTMSRTIMTAMTVFMVVAILFVFGGEILRSFSFAMLIGVIFGSYSSIFIAVPIVLDLSKKSLVEPVKL
jgi:SecD/SecF fusion protein